MDPERWSSPGLGDRPDPRGRVELVGRCPSQHRPQQLAHEHVTTGTVAPRPCNDRTPAAQHSALASVTPATAACLALSTPSASRPTARHLPEHVPLADVYQCLPVTCAGSSRTSPWPSPSTASASPQPRPYWPTRCG